MNERRKGRKPKFDPAFLEVEKLTGEENVSVINRLTGKKVGTGARGEQWIWRQVFCISRPLAGVVIKV